jgi:hypothetical protein
MDKDRLPKTSDYQNEPVRYPALERLDIIAEASAIEQQYRNIVLNQVIIIACDSLSFRAIIRGTITHIPTNCF